MSDQTLQTLSGEAVDPTDVPYSAIFADIYSRSVTSRPIGYRIDFGTSNSAVAVVYAERRDAFTAVVHGLGVRAQQLWSAKPLPA